MDGAQRLQQTLHELIPLSAAMGLEVVELGPEHLVLDAPLARNHNHSGQGFAGSLYSLASLAGWAMLRQLVEREGVEAQLVLGEANIRYRRPLETDLRVRVELSQADQQAVIARLRSGRTVRLPLEMAIPDSDDPAAVFSGTYFAKP